MTTVIRRFANPAAAAAVAPADVNGSGGQADLSTSVTFVHDSNRFVRSANGGLHVRYSLSYVIWVAQGKPGTVAVVTEDHLATAAPRIGNTLYRVALLDAIAAGNAGVTLRSTDSLLAGDWEAVPEHGRADTVADAIWEAYVTDPVAASALAPNAALASLAVIANALHRHMSEGHNWFTDAASVRGSPTAKCLGVAGGSREEFTQFMERWGHDLWHFLSDRSLSAVAGWMVGEPELPLDRGYAIQGFVSVAPYPQFNLSDVYKLGEAARDRWPPGTIGISALILCFPLIVSMLQGITVRVQDVNTGAVVGRLESISATLKTAKPARADMLSAKNAMQGITSIAYGYATTVGSTTVDRYKSLAAFANRAPMQVEQGTLLGQWSKGKTIIDARMTDQFNALITATGAAMDAVTQAIGSQTTSTTQASGTATTQPVARRQAVGGGQAAGQAQAGTAAPGAAASAPPASAAAATSAPAASAAPPASSAPATSAATSTATPPPSGSGTATTPPPSGGGSASAASTP